MSDQINSAIGEGIARVREMVNQHRRLEGLLPDSFSGFGPSDLMLELFLAEAEGKRLFVTGVCDRCPVPLTTVLRWLDRLVETGMIVRTRDTKDARRQFVDMTPKASGAFSAFVQEQFGVDLEPKQALAA